MVSAEALLRWQHPARGLLSPHEFIPLAEETGLIVPIGAWVIEQACSRLVEWQRVAPAMSVAVNVSVRQLAVPDIADRIHDILRATGRQPSTLCLELTESVSMENVDYSGTLAALKALGVRLAIDDFGTGYSSLSYLKRFSLDAVKVDRTFVDGLGTDPHDTALVTAIVAMADALRLEVTAEGVETRDQLLNLEQLGCPRTGFLPRAADAPRAADGAPRRVAPLATQLTGSRVRWRSLAEPPAYAPDEQHREQRHTNRPQRNGPQVRRARRRRRNRSDRDDDVRHVRRSTGGGKGNLRARGRTAQHDLELELPGVVGPDSRHGTTDRHFVQ